MWQQGILNWTSWSQTHSLNFDADHVQATLGLRYSNIRKIGAGGMAAVFGAYDAVLKRPVAIKLVADTGNSNELLMRFQREAKLASRLNHPNIVTIMDFGVAENGTLYLIMDFIEGKSLKELLEDSGPLDAETAIYLFIQVCDALAHSHKQGVVHRDLKPGNIMIAAEAEEHADVRVVDFGLAKVVAEDQRITKTGKTIGTPIYSAPEQIEANAADHRSDIYSFGCVMLEVLTGSPPFRGETAIETYDMHINKPAPRLLERGFEHEHAERLDQLIATALEKDPEKRFSGFEELKQELIDLLPEESKVAISKVEEKYAKDRYKAQSFFSQHKKALLAICLFTLVLGGAGLLRIEQRNKAVAESKRSRFMEGSFEVDTSKWKFFCRDQKGVPTWTNIDCRMSDEHFKQLQGKDVRSVVLYAMRLKGWGLKYLKNEPIQTLSVAESKIIDKNLHYIGNLKTLKSLDLSYTWITDAGLDSINELPELKVLGLAGCTKLTAKSIDSVTRIGPQIKELNISLTPVGKEGLESLDKLKQLRSLDISLTGWTDQSIAPIYKLKKIERLKIGKNKELTDTTLEQIGKLPKLNYLKIEGCEGFSSEAIEKFKTSHPKVELVSEETKRKVPDLLKMQL